MSSIFASLRAARATGDASAPGEGAAAPDPAAPEPAAPEPAAPEPAAPEPAAPEPAAASEAAAVQNPAVAPGADGGVLYADAGLPGAPEESGNAPAATAVAAAAAAVSAAAAVAASPAAASPAAASPAAASTAAASRAVAWPAAVTPAAVAAAPTGRKRQRTRYNESLKYSHAIALPDVEGRSVCQFCVVFGREVPAGGVGKRRRKASRKPLVFDDFSRCRIEEHYRLTHPERFGKYKAEVEKDGPSNRLLRVFFGGEGEGEGEGNGVRGEDAEIVEGGVGQGMGRWNGEVRNALKGTTLGELRVLKEEGVQVDKVKNMSRGELAAALAAFIVGYQEDEGERFLELRKKLGGTFGDKYIFGGDVLVGEDAMDPRAFREIIGMSLKEKDEVNPSPGLMTLLKRFTRKLDMEG